MTETDTVDGSRAPDAKHAVLAEALRRRVLEGPGDVPAALRRTVAARAAGGAPIDPPYDDLARQIGADARGVRDAQVAAVIAASGGQRAAFELVMSAAAGAGFLRWRAGLRAIVEAMGEAQ
jgi:hypothetical protein